MNTGIFITVRTGSTRLPRKALMEVDNKPIIGYLIDRLKYNIDSLAELIICTTDLKEDYVLDDLAREYGIKSFHGDKNNIIKRHLDCANTHNVDFIINIDGDDILCNPEYVRKIIDAAKSNDSCDVIRTSGLPFGTNSMGYKREVLEKILNSYDYKQIETGWGGLIFNSEMFNIHDIAAEENEKDDVRLTLDYEQDFMIFKNIIENLWVDDKYISQDMILNYIKENPHIKKINEELNEVYWENFNNNKKKERNL